MSAFGWTLDDEGELVADKSQQAAITRMVALRQAGQSLRAIADTMRAEGQCLSRWREEDHRSHRKELTPTII